MEPPAIPFSFSLTPEHEDMHPTATPSLHSFHTPTASSWTPLPHTPLYSPCGISWKDLSAKVHSSELLTGHHLLYTDSRPSMEIEDSIIANDDDHHNSMNTYNGMGGQGALSPVHAPSGQGSLSDSMCAEKASKPTAITGSLSQQLTEAISGRATHDEVCCPNMSAFSVYDSALQQHYMLPSETVVVTLGSIKYVTLFEKYGSQTRYKFQLCERYQHGACPDGSSCTYIHCVSVPNSTTVHDNENFIKSFRSSTFTAEELAGGKNTKGYATLRAGAVLDVYPPNDSNKAPQRIRSEHILRTAGALAAFEVRAAAHGLALGIEFMSLGSCTPLGERSPTAHSEAVKIRHCAHFQYKRMCHRGPSCSFIHSLVPYVQKLAPSLDSESSAHHTDCATPTCLIALTPSQSMSLTPLHGLGPAQGAVEIRTDKVPYGGQSTVWPDRPVPTITMLPPSIAAMAPPQAELHPPMNLGIPFPNTSPLASTASGASLVSLTPTSSTTLVSPLTLLAWPWGGPPLPPACVVGKPPVGYPMTTFPADPQLSAANINGNGAAHLINAHNVGPALLWPH